MAINKKLIHFENRANFDVRLANNEINDTSIVFIQDTGELWTHGKFFCKDYAAYADEAGKLSIIQTKTYTNVIGTANNNPGAVFYFMSVRPIDWNAPCTVKYRINSSIEGLPTGTQYSIVTMTFARASQPSYDIWNYIGNTSYRPFYYHYRYLVTQTGYNAGYGHLIGLGMLYAYNPTTAANSRTFIIDVLELDNATCTLFDSMTKYANVQGTGSTNFTSEGTFDGTTLGETHLGDRLPDYLAGSYYFRSKVNSDGYVGRYMLVMRCPNGTVTGLTTTNNSTGTTKTMYAGPLLLGDVFYYASTSAFAANGNFAHDGANIRNNYSLVDVRYTFNCGSTLVSYKPFFIVGSMLDGYFYLDLSQPWSQEWPTENEEGKVYILVGHAYDNYRTTFELNNPAYIFKNGKLQLYNLYSAEVDWNNIIGTPATFTPSTHTHPYTDLTGSTTTADQAIVSSGTADGWTLKTLGSHAFDSTAYLPLAGGTMDAEATITLKKIGATRKLILSGNSITADLTAAPNGYAGSFLTVKSIGSDEETHSLTVLGMYGTNGSGDTGLSYIYFGGTYSDPLVKITPEGDITSTLDITAAKFVKSGGTSAQFLKADGSVDTNTYITASSSITGNAASATEFESAQSITLTGDTTGTASSKAGWSIATTTKYLTGTSSGNTALATTAMTTAMGNGKVTYYYKLTNNTTGLFATNNNANSMFTFNKHDGNYDSQLGFSSNGNIYYRNFNGEALNTTKTWKQIAFTDSNITGQASYAANVGSAGTLGTNYVTAAKVIAACNWYDTVTGSDTDSVINRWDEIVNFVAGFEETPDLATYLENNYLAKTGNSTSSPMTGTIYVKDVNPLILLSTNKNLDIWRVTGDSTAWNNTYGFYLRYNGAGSGNENSLSLWANNQAGNDIEVYRVKLDGILNFLKAPTINGTAISLTTHDHDDRYLKLIGGTLTGTLNLDSNTMGAVAHLTFNREWSYLLNKASGGKFAFLANNAAAGASANADLIIADGAIYPGTSGHTSLGSSTLKFSQLHLSGAANVGGTLTAASSLYLTGLAEGTYDVTDDTELVTSYAGTSGFANTTGAGQAYRRKASKLYNYIKGKTDSLYSTIEHNHDASYVTAVGVTDDTTNHANQLRYIKNGVSTYFTVPYADKASKIGSNTVGSTSLPVYINNGTPNVISKIPGNLIQGSGINSLINTSAAVGINPAINAAGMNLAKGGDVRVFIDDFEFVYSPGYLDILFDGLNSTYFVPLNSNLGSQYNYSSSKNYSTGNFVVYNNTSNAKRWYRSKVNNNIGNSPLHEQDNDYWEYVSGTGGYETGINPQKINSITLLITLALAANYESGVSIYWRTSGQHPRYLTILKYSDASFTNLVGTPCTRLDMQGEVITTVYCGLAGSSYGTYYKITLEGFSGQSYWACALTQIAFTGLCGGIEGTVVMRKGGSYASMFGDFYPYSNKGANLGTSSYNWNNVYAEKFVKSGGTSSLFLKADGSVDSNTYVTSASIGNGTLSLQAAGTTKTTFTANQSGNATFNITTGTINGAISVGGANVTVKGFGSNGVNKDFWIGVNSLYVNFDAENKTFRRGTGTNNADTTLGTATYPWKALYATTIYENGTSLADTYLKLTGGTITGNLTLSSTTGDSPLLIFLRGTLTDTLDDWRILNTSGQLKFQHTTVSPTDWKDYVVYSATAGTVMLGSNTVIHSGNYSSYVTSTYINNAINGLYVGGYISNLKSGYLITHPEHTHGTIIPFLHNDIAFLNKRGGTVSIYSTTSTDLTPATLTVKKSWGSGTTFDAMFNASASYYNFGNNNSSEMNADGIIIDISLFKNFTYSNKFYIDFGSSTWAYKNIDILVGTGGVYTSKVEGGTVNGSCYFSSLGGGDSGYNKLRIHLYNRTETLGVRIAQIGLIAYSSPLLRGTTMSRGIDDPVFRDITPNDTNTYSLGSSTAQWNNLYVNTIYENGTSLASKYVTLSTDLSITGEKTFTGDKRIKFKLGTATDRLGFTLYDLNNKEMGGLELKPGAINSKPALTLFHYRGSVGYPTQQNYVGFRLYDKNASAAYYLVTPLPEDAKTAITNLNLTDRVLYFPLLFKYGANTVLTSSAGVVDLTNVITTSGNVTVNSMLASSSSGTTAITGDTLNPYYNLLVNSAVSSSIQFKAGTNMAITADTNNGITFDNTLTKMSQLTNNLFINGTQTGTTGSWKGKLPAEITSLYNGLTIFYRLPHAGSGNASLQLYAPDGTTAIGANCPVYAGTTRITTHFPADSIIHMTYYEGNWRAHPYYNTNSYVTQTNSTSTDYRAILLGNQSSSSVSGVATGAVTNQSYKSSNFVYSPGGGRLYIRTADTSSQHGYYVASTVTNAGYAVGLVMMSDLISRGVRDTYNGKWLWYMNDTTGDTVKTDATVQIDSGIVKLSANCLIAYDSTNQCINFTFT